MNPDSNGNHLAEVKLEGVGALLEDYDPSLDAPASPDPIKDAAAPQTWATRVDALKTVATNRKPMVLLGFGLGAAVLLFIITSFFGKTPSKKGSLAPQNSTQTSPASKPKGSVTPLMDSVHNPADSDTAGHVTPADISRTKSSLGSQSLTSSTQTGPPKSTTVAANSLASVPPFESTQQRWEEPKPYGEQQTPVTPSTASAQVNLLKGASLVFVKKTEQANDSASATGNPVNDSAPESSVTPGTRIQARLETQASSAVSAPVVAVVEYTYSLGDHLVIPAGARVYGQLQQADRSGAVSIKFNEIELLDGVREKIEASAGQDALRTTSGPHYLGQSGNKVKQLFERARAHSPCILFLDELDIVAPDRSGTRDDPMTREIVGQLLQEIDGVQVHPEHIFLVGATNRTSSIDSAILSRFNERLPIPLPGREARTRLLAKFLKGKKLAFPVDDGAILLADLSDAKGLSGRDLRSWVGSAEQKALLRAMQNGGPEQYVIALDDFSPAS